MTNLLMFLGKYLSIGAILLAGTHVLICAGAIKKLGGYHRAVQKYSDSMDESGGKDREFKDELLSVDTSTEKGRVKYRELATSWMIGFVMDTVLWPIRVPSLWATGLETFGFIKK